MGYGEGKAQKYIEGEGESMGAGCIYVAFVGRGAREGGGGNTLLLYL